MAWRPAYGALAAALALAACAPVPVHLAERQCYERFAPKAPISGEAAMGVTSDGFRSNLEVNLSLGASVTGDPSAAYNRCVMDRSGQMPTRPYWDFAGARP